MAAATPNLQANTTLNIFLNGDKWAYADCPLFRPCANSVSLTCTLVVYFNKARYIIYLYECIFTLWIKVSMFSGSIKKKFSRAANGIYSKLLGVNNEDVLACMLHVKCNFVMCFWGLWIEFTILHSLNLDLVWNYLRIWPCVELVLTSIGHEGEENFWNLLYL